MVRLGTGTSALDKLDEMLAEVEVAVDGEEIDVPIFPKKKDIRFNRKVDSARPDVDIFETLVEEIETQTWRDYMKAARKARDVRLVDERYAKYGPLKDFVRGNPTGEALVYKLEKAWSSEIVWLNPIMPWGQAMMIMFMATKAGFNDWKMMVLCIILLGMHPHLIVIGFVGFTIFKNRKPSYPKGTKSISKLDNSPTIEEEANEDLPTYNKEPKDVDIVVLGTDFGSMYTAALLSRCGRKVLVLDCKKEEEDSIEYGCLVKFDGLEFVIGDQSLPGGSQAQLYIDQLASALSPSHKSNDDKQQWSRIGGEQGIHSVVSINKGDPVISGSGITEKFREFSQNGVIDVTKHAAGVVVKLQEAANILCYGQKLPPKKATDMSWTDQMVAKIRKRVVESQVVASSNLSGVSAEEVLNNSAIMGEGLVNLRSRDPALYQLLLSQCVARENISPNDVSFMTLAISFCDWLNGRVYPKHGIREVFRGFSRTIKGNGGSIMRADVQEIMVQGGTTQGVRLKDGSVIKVKEGVVSGLGIHDTITLMPQTKNDELLKKLSMLRRARPVVHTLISLNPSESAGDDDLRVFAAQYTEIPALLETSGEICAASQGGAGCGPHCRNWMQINFPSAQTSKDQDRVTCVITTEAEDGWDKEDQFNKFKALHEKHVKKRLLDLFPSIKEHHIGKIKVMKPVYRGISSGVATLADTYENAQGVVSVFVRPALQGINGLYFTSKDVIGGVGVKAQMVGASLCLHSILGYDTTDVLIRQRNAIREINSHS